MNVPAKVTAQHLARNAYLYVRQSSLHQVNKNQESTKRQYALRERATALGWQPDQIEVIDCDLGKSGASAAGRDGFQHLVAQVGLGHAGIVLGLEVSRLARNCADWHQLLQICAFTATLILDEDGLYDPAQYNDRLLLGLKGTMSEAELHLMRARLQGGLLAKARRGELKIGLPIGLVYDPRDRVVLHPDAQVRATIKLAFETFHRTGAAAATVRALNEQQVLMPAHVDRSHRNQDVLWRRVTLNRVIHMLHNPRYAGAFAFGRRRSRTLPGGRTRVTKVPREEWEVLLLDHHPGYIDWAQFERNQKRLADNNKGSFGSSRTPREGVALLQGLALCGMCGARMSVRYTHHNDRLTPTYFCVRQVLRHGGSSCQTIVGTDIDAAIGQLVVEAMSPMAIQLTLAVQEQLQSRIDETERLRQMQIQRAEQDVELARQRYMQVDPGNRLVAGTLEADWNSALRALEQARDDAERQRRADAERFDQATRDRISALAADFPALWNDRNTPQRERKRMLALLIDDVTLRRGEEITANVRFRGGATTTLTLPLPIMYCDRRRTPPATVAEADRLLEQHTDSEVAAILDERGFTTGAGATFTTKAVEWIRRAHNLPSLKERLLAAGGLRGTELAGKLGLSFTHVREMARNGQLKGRRSNDSGERIFAPLAQQPETIRRRAARRAKLDQTSETPASPARGAV